MYSICRNRGIGDVGDVSPTVCDYIQDFIGKRLWTLSPMLKTQRMHHLKSPLITDGSPQITDESPVNHRQITDESPTNHRQITDGSPIDHRRIIIFGSLKDQTL